MEKKTKKETSGGYLIATKPILYEGRQFEAGEKLPAYDEKMVEAWIRYKAARREGEKIQEEEKPEESMEDEENEEPAENVEPEESEKSQEKSKSSRKK